MVVPAVFDRIVGAAVPRDLNPGFLAAVFIVFRGLIMICNRAVPAVTCIINAIVKCAVMPEMIRTTLEQRIRPVKQKSLFTSCHIATCKN